MNKNKEVIIAILREEALNRNFASAAEQVAPMTDAERKEIMAQMPSVVAGLTQLEPSLDEPAVRFECH